MKSFKKVLFQFFQAVERPLLVVQKVEVVLLQFDLIIKEGMITFLKLLKNIFGVQKKGLFLTLTVCLTL
ncbi:MAG: hypothetical protein WC682_05475 [Parcubacteria group bacterium]|jgi:hypothetical protein